MYLWVAKNIFPKTGVEETQQTIMQYPGGRKSWELSLGLGLKGQEDRGITNKDSCVERTAWWKLEPWVEKQATQSSLPSLTLLTS